MIGDIGHAVFVRIRVQRWLWDLQQELWEEYGGTL